MSSFFRSKLAAALACYLILAVVAGFTLDGYLRAAIWLLMLWLAFKTWRSSEEEPHD